MLKKMSVLLALACALFSLGGAESEKISVPLKGIVILVPGFRATDISITDRNIISAETIANDQIRVTGLAVGKSDLHITSGSVSKLYTVTVNDNVREIFNSLRKDLDSVPEVEISINGNKVVLKGEVSSIDGWETLLKVLPSYGAAVTNLTVFRPAPESSPRNPGSRWFPTSPISRPAPFRSRARRTPSFSGDRSIVRKMWTPSTS